MIAIDKSVQLGSSLSRAFVIAGVVQPRLESRIARASYTSGSGRPRAEKARRCSGSLSLSVPAGRRALRALEAPLSGDLQTTLSRVAAPQLDYDSTTGWMHGSMSTNLEEETLEEVHTEEASE
uniref:Uncharacterized protein n=1 Tax=Peronospora matthiolae TaxID=2874970 RepID=A0AAV1TND7_9STRA